MPRKFLTQIEIENLMKDLDEENFDDSDSEYEDEFENSIFENNEVDLDVSANFDEKLKAYSHGKRFLKNKKQMFALLIPIPRKFCSQICSQLSSIKIYAGEKRMWQQKYLFTSESDSQLFPSYDLFGRNYGFDYDEGQTITQPPLPVASRNRHMKLCHPELLEASKLSASVGDSVYFHLKVLLSNILSMNFLPEIICLMGKKLKIPSARHLLRVHLTNSVVNIA
ncbi:hypothetical protein TNCT_428471 [Trichonephila clavata]|uniref:Uncharacterized protein n=1 Tax=Trichonephila clavata TaxID=2740835 RepID=A0A8X6J692_TRICU|nr:hypothetical protein TNCT_428471 [Trichonephila clavata]